MVDAAVEYARRGWPVLPLHSISGDGRCSCGREDCDSPAKHPRTMHGVKDATTDEDRIRAWWAQWPEANIGVSTGAATFVALDLDVKPDGTDGAEIVKALHGWEPAGPIQRTGGGGLQALYAHPGGRVPCKTALLDGVDVRGDDGYVVVPPSLHASGRRYEWIEGPDGELPPMPPWLVEALDVATRAPQGAHVAKNSPERAYTRDPAVERRAAAYVDAMPPAISGQGGHNATYAAATALVHGFGIAPEQALQILLERYNPRCEPPWTEKELRHKVEDAAAKPHDMPFGWLRDYEPDPGSGVNLAAFGILSDEPEPEHPDPGAIPDSLLHVPGFVSEVMDYTLETAPYPEPVLAFCGALSLQAFLAGRKVRDPGDNRTNLYVLGLANTGSGKEHPRKVNQRILLDVGLQDSLGDAFASGEGIEDRLFCQPSMLFQTDEIDAVMVAIKEGKEARYEGIMQMLLKMYTSSNGLYPMRVKAGKEHKVIDQPSLCIFGTAIPKNYYEALSVKMLTNGFFARMLIVEVGRRGKGQEPVVRDLPPRVLETARWWAGFMPGTGNLERWHPIPKVVKQTPEATAVLTDLRDQADREYAAAEDKDDAVGMAIWARASEKARRLALIYACSEHHEQPVVGEAAARWAWDFVAYLTRRMLFMARSHVADNPFHAECLKVIERLRNAPGQQLPHSALLRRMKTDAKSFRELIETLVQRGDVTVTQVTTPGRTGTWYGLTAQAKGQEAVTQGVEGERTASTTAASRAKEGE